ncbi:TetR/AcrR family transcriptional regulator [Streptomyces armeniacus]|uniref:TetR/AcrR family transcriptional regulator n=1 Tax=Streptomyces armeniacus TaxID=83291 RepID=A0A345XLS8_9ACTN|nr:TetR/AcrR family transcriptional regulator [Streptomyces armeniacus]AXK32594.1 TetR/AcrR family transcriptional regulator [Streptomyces armeniacus]
MEDISAPTAGKGRYHHGDLRNALIDAAVGLARAGGPDAVVLRAAARQVGVSPTAAYRHFAGQSDLLFAVKTVGQQMLAERMEGAAGSVPGEPDEGVEERVLAMGKGYIGFALDEPGLFRSAFCNTPDLAMGLSDEGVPQPASGEHQFRSFELLIGILDGLVASGLMPPARRPGAEVAAWSLVHGLAMLILDGPFSLLPDDQRDAAVDRALRTLVAGFTAP